MSEPFYVEFYDDRDDQPCTTESDAHQVLALSRGAIWWAPDGPAGSTTCRRDTNDTHEEREHRDAAWRLAYLARA